MPNKIAPRKSERKKNRRKKRIRRRNSRRTDARPVERHHLSIYSGTTWLGNVDQHGNEYTARSIRGKKIGCYATLTAAADAVSATAEAAA
jgi:hypothetical protein